MCGPSSEKNKIPSKLKNCYCMIVADVCNDTNTTLILFDIISHLATYLADIIYFVISTALKIYVFEFSVVASNNDGLEKRHIPNTSILDD